MTPEELKVTCYSGHTYAERPESFEWGGREYKIKEIEKAWLEPGKRCFRVRTGENKSFKLCYNEITDRWSISEVGRSEDAERDSQDTGE